MKNPIVEGLMQSLQKTDTTYVICSGIHVIQNIIIINEILNVALISRFSDFWLFCSHEFMACCRSACFFD